MECPLLVVRWEPTEQAVAVVVGARSMDLVLAIGHKLDRDEKLIHTRVRARETMQPPIETSCDTLSKRGAKIKTALSATARLNSPGWR